MALRPTGNLAAPPPAAIIVMGVSGSGKSTLAAMMAEGFGCPFLEGDSYHAREAIAKMRGGEPLTDADRWPWLDRLGTAIGETVATHGVAIAACSALRRSYRDRLRATITCPTRFLLLDIDRGSLLQRLVQRPGHYMPPSLLDSQLATLEAPSGDELALILDGRTTPAELYSRAFDWLRTVPAR